MSVIWSGITEEGAVVPVQVTEEGKVVAVGDGPEGDYLKLTGGNLTGDLTVNEQITLATAGSASFAGSIKVGKRSYNDINLFDNNANNSPLILLYGSATSAEANSTPAISVQRRESGQGSQPFVVNYDGSASFAGSINLGDVSQATGNNGIELNALGYATFVVNTGTPASFPVIAAYSGTTETIKLESGGGAKFAGDVVIGSRGEQWLIRESNGVAMLVQQTLRQPRMEKLRDLPNELDLIEAALSEIMEKLRMTPPAGWPVWNGSDNA